MQKEKIKSALEKLQDKGKLAVVFRAVAGDRLAECLPTGMPGFESLDLLMHGNNEDLTESFLLDTLMIATADKGSEISVVNPQSKIVARAYRGITSYRVVDLDSLRAMVYGEDVEVDSYTEKAPDGYEELDEEVEDFEEDFEEDLEEEDPGEVEVYEEDEESTEPEKSSADELKMFYADYINGVKNELLKRYTGLFASGYEVSKPDGLLTQSGIVSLSGSELKVKENSAATMQLYAMFKDFLGISESPARSRVEIANQIYSGYTSGKGIIYFPNKMVEFAYGREPSGAKAESLKTYKPHSSASSWASYRDQVVSKAIKSLIEDSVVRFIELTVPEGEDNKSVSVINSVRDFLKYFQTCLSMCLLMVAYKKSGGKPTKFALRVCDPEDKLGDYDYTPEIINKAFIGGTGEVPYSYAPRFEDESKVREYSHEFNHDVSQAMPLFAYKALDALKAQGVSLSWRNAIMGTFEDGSILRNGTHGVDMLSKLIHWMMAGSRAGKGVMTLNLLASAIASNKSIFYADRKPDMASVLKYLAGGMCVINGGGYAEQYDRKYRQFTDLDSLLDKNHIPKEALQVFQTSATWDELGDLVYMRFLKLAVGIIVARAEGRSDDPNFGGKEGIFLVLDEFKNFQDSFSTLCTRAAGIVPPSTISKDREALTKGSISQDTFNASYNDAGYYALSYLNSLAEDMKFLAEKTDAGFNQEEIGLSDIIIIGQSLERGAVDRLEFQDMLRNAPGSARYRSAGSFGLKGFNLVGKSIPFNLVSFKPMDAFFGRNMDDGRSVYLAQTNRDSKAFGRLDDKASNFAYMSTFTEEKRQKIVGGRVAENISMANSCTYFKPFLILNTGDPEDDCVQGCKRRCFENGGVTEADLIEEYPNDTGYGNPNDINPCVGFEDYLKRAGLDGYRESLEKSSRVANYVVQQCLGYPGNWFEFITDLRPEWMFTIRDISDGAKLGAGGTRLSDITTNPVTKEWYEFNQGLGQGECSGGSGDFLYDDGAGDDFSDPEETFESTADTWDRADEESNFENGEEIDLFESDPIKDVWIEETGTEEQPLQQDFDSKKIMDLLDQLRQYGVDVQVAGEDGGWVARDMQGNPMPQGFGSTDRSEFGDEFARIEYTEDIASLEQMINVITNDILRKFGGLERIFSFKVVGGSIIINGYYYRCKVKDMYARNIPYDVRRDINAGNVSGLFNYSLLRKMPALRDMEFDSAAFVYDNVSSALGYGSSISVDRFFKDFRMLQTLAIGKDRFTRQNHMEKIQGNDFFYKQRVGERFANAVDAGLGRASSSSWNWTKRVWGDKRRNIWVRLAGGTVGATAAATTKLGQAGTKIGRKIPGAVSAFGRGIKDLFNT